MRLSVVRCLTVLTLASPAGACAPGLQKTEPPLLPIVSGTVGIPSLSAPVRVVRDRYGVPHIYAKSRDDLFVAQGFVQAEDRLFQMDLWRRAVQGRLSEVLGPNFIERDAMTRRVQYRGSLHAEWASYGADTKAIANAFAVGINAWVDLARQRPPEAFLLAGWFPDHWSAEDLLNRTDAFVASTGALDDVARFAMSDVVAEAVRRVGTAPFFTLLARPVRSPDGTSPSDRELLPPAAFVPASSARTSGRDHTLEVSESGKRYEVPSPRYVVHLNAPGWNVIGATVPWRPGVAIGHNDTVGWGFIPAKIFTQHVREQPVDPATRVVKDTIVVKGREQPFEFETEITSQGIVIASDREHERRFVLQWTGFEPGWAFEMASTGLDVARNESELQSAASRWKSPPGRFVVIDRSAKLPTRYVEAPLEALREVQKRTSRVEFAHPLGITAPARQRFNVGPLNRPAEDQLLRLFLDARDWDQSRAINPPGQSEAPESGHFADLAVLWSAGEMFALAFSDEAVEAIAAATLILTPGR